MLQLSASRIPKLLSSSDDRLYRSCLEATLNDFESSIEPCRTKPTATFGLHLQPEQLDGIVCVQSRSSMKDGQWENR